MLYANKNRSVAYNMSGGRTKLDTSTYLRNIYLDSTEWQPSVKKISSQEIKKFEKKEERNNRYNQRKR